jgi:hypothetical protein
MMIDVVVNHYDDDNDEDENYDDDNDEDVDDFDVIYNGND